MFDPRHCVPNEAITADAIIGRVDGLMRRELPALPLARYGAGPEVYEPAAYALTVIQTLYGTDHPTRERACAAWN
jgi:hypothetical protein